MKNFEDDVVQVNFDRKRTEKGKINSVLVRKRGGALRMRRQPSSYLIPNTASAPSDRSSKTAATTETFPNHRERLINYWKCPTYETKRRFSVI
jgi:hypothetical protein